MICIAVEKGYLKGDGVEIKPKFFLTRAEACMMLYRVLESKAGNIKLDLGVRKIELTLKGGATVTLDQAKRWASSRGAHQRFIDIADTYWKYGELTGIRPEILYAQAAKETGFGKYSIIGGKKHEETDRSASGSADGSVPGRLRRQGRSSRSPR